MGNPLLNWTAFGRHNTGARVASQRRVVQDPNHLSSPRPIRVAVVAPSLRILGGQAVQAQRLLDGWRDDPEVDAWLVPHNPVPPAPFDRLLEIKYVRTLVTQLCYWPMLLRELRRADVVHVFSASYASFLMSPLPAILIARLFGRPVVLNYRSGEAPDHLRRSAVARWALRSVSRNVVPSPFLKEVFAGFAIPSEVIANVADLARFRYAPRDPLRPRLVSTRNFDALYNVSCTLRAFARVQARYPDASLTLVGSGPQDAMLRALAGELGLRNVTFVGRVAQSDIHRYYADADIYIQTPSIDNMPGSVIEAFASGLPVVSTDVGGVPAILQHGVHGLLAADNDDDAIAAHVIHLIDRPEDARRLAAAAFDTCRGYEWPVVRERWLATYRELAAASAARRRDLVRVEAA
jgi:glycosyltransferase involved in cell wall biosynthesis